MKLDKGIIESKKDNRGNANRVIKSETTNGLDLLKKREKNRVKRILLEVVDEEHSAFIQKILISNNVFIATKCFHYLKKLNMLIAYDQVESPFVEKVLTTMGFPKNSLRS